MCRVYVDKAEQELLGTVANLLREETWKPMEDAGQLPAASGSPACSRCHFVSEQQVLPSAAATSFK